MTTRSDHLDFEELNDLVDGRLTLEQSAVVEAHVQACAACRSEHDRLRQLLALTDSLPRSVLPEEDVWPDIRRALDDSKEIVLPVAGGNIRTDSPAREDRKRQWRGRLGLAAAAVVLIALSSGITTLVLQSRGAPEQTANAGAVRAAEGDSVNPVLLPIGFQEAEAEYVKTIDQLEFALDAQRDRLSPETVRTVERSLAVVDSAIAEGRAALLADPNNRTIVDLLSASYQRKLDLLKRASELGSRI